MPPDNRWVAQFVSGGEERHLGDRSPVVAQLVSRAGEGYIISTMGKHLASVLTTVNSPYGVQLDDAALALCLVNLDLAKQHPGHVSTFLGEVSPVLQVEFAAAHHIAVPDLKAFAAAFSAWSGESYPLAA